MSIRTESYESHQNEDGSITTTEVTTYTPPTKKEQATAWLVFGTVCLLPVVPYVAVTVHEKIVEKREARKARKAEQKN